jgi:hypothetical protein
MIKEEIQLPIQRVFFWTDSTIVIQYIRNSGKRFQTFVSNRLQLIHDSSSPSQWFHVPTEVNPADHASRGIQGNGLNDETVKHWFQGPAFLWQPDSEWPSQPADLLDIGDEDKELKRCKTHASIMTSSTADPGSMDKLLQQFSSWYKLQKCIAWLLRFKNYLLSRVRNSSPGPVERGPITVSEISVATVEIIKLVQQKSFPKEMSVGVKMLSARPDGDGYVSPLLKLCPVLTNGIIRVGGRLSNAPIDSTSKHQMILPHNHHVTEMIIRHCHEKSGHVGAN